MPNLPFQTPGALSSPGTLLGLSFFSSLAGPFPVVLGSLGHLRFWPGALGMECGFLCGGTPASSFLPGRLAWGNGAHLGTTWARPPAHSASSAAERWGGLFLQSLLHGGSLWLSIHCSYHITPRGRICQLCSRFIHSSVSFLFIFSTL